MKQFSMFLGLVLLLPKLAYALPILTESEDNYARLATILPDHEDKKKRYFFPNRGGLEMSDSAVPRFALTYWDATPGEEIGGLMTAIMNLRIGGDLQASINQSLKEGYKTTILPAQKSYLRFMEDKEGTRVIDGIFHEADIGEFSGRPEDSFGVTASLTPRGGGVLATQVLNAGMGAKMEYCYEIKGVSPVFHGKITMNYKKVYEHFVARASGGRLWWKWSIKREIEELVEKEAIRIEINGGDAKQIDYIAAVADRMAVKFFEPRTENRKISASGKYGLAKITIREDRESVFEMKQREIIDREYCLAVAMDDIKKFPWLVNKVQ